MKKAFTLIELLVVIGIIGILSAIAFATFSGGTDSARAARCLTNMRNLAAACQTYGMRSGSYPYARSLEYCNLDGVYSELRGWISSATQGAYSGNPKSSRANASWNTSCYDTDVERRTYCITNGSLWKYISENHDVYICPLHKSKMKLTKQNNLDPNWSYLMSARFGWTAKPGIDIETPGGNDGLGMGYRTHRRSDRYLLFSEINFPGATKDSGYNGLSVPLTTSAGEACDCILQYKGSRGSSANESIAFNHKVGKMIFGNVAFADGHVEKLVYPKKGLSESELQELTQWLCTGKDVSFSGSKYKKLEN